MSDKQMNDPFGIKPFGEAANTIVTKTFQGIEAFFQQLVNRHWMNWGRC